MIIVDTPGLHKPHDALGEELNTSALKALEDVDVIAMLIDASASPSAVATSGWQPSLTARIASTRRRSASFPRATWSPPSKCTNSAEAAKKLANWDAMVGLSSESGYNVDAFIEEVQCFLPEGPAWFPADMETDQPIEVIVAEFIREKILRTFRDEVPSLPSASPSSIWSTTRRRTSTASWPAFTWSVIPRRASSSARAVAQSSASAQEAREDLEQLLGTRVYLGPYR